MTTVSYALIRNRPDLVVAHACRTLGVSRAGYYRALQAGQTPKASTKIAVQQTIRERFAATGGIEGAGRLREHLKRLGFDLSKATVSRYVREMGLKRRVKRKFRHTTDSDHPHPPSPHLAKAVTPTEIHQVWVSDITYIHTLEGWLYLAMIMDLFSRKIVGYSMGTTLKTELIAGALLMALDREGPAPGLIFHSDKGSQYASKAFRDLLVVAGFRQSMGAVGSCFDNAHAEALNHALKVECIYPTTLRTRDEARAEVFAWIELYYNKKRFHSSLNYCTPEEKHVKSGPEQITAA